MRDDHLATLKRNMYSAANLDMPKPCSRADQVDEICQGLGLETYHVRPYANCITVQLPAETPEDRDYLVTIDNKDTLQDARSMIAKTAGIDLKRTMKAEHKPSDEAMRKFSNVQLAEYPWVEKPMVVGPISAAQQPTYKLQQPGGVWLDCMPDGSVRWRDGQ